MIVFQSHVTLTVRLGALLFGAVTTAYFFMYTIKHLKYNESAVDAECSKKFKRTNYLLMTAFAVLQSVFIFAFPRVNFHSLQLLNRLQQPFNFLIETI